MLLGCSSGRLLRHGRSLDPLGVVQSYLIGKYSSLIGLHNNILISDWLTAASPALVGFLWPVIDKDIDSWTISFLDHWLKGGQVRILSSDWLTQSLLISDWLTGGAAAGGGGQERRLRKHNKRSSAGGVWSAIEN